jgi:CarD family transcriptional regulator
MAVKSSGAHKVIDKGDPSIALFSVNDRVVYPGHGVAKINRIVEKVVGPDVVRFFELRFVHKEMTVLVPTTNLSSVGIRPLSSSIYIHNVFSFLSQPPKEVSPYELTASNWNKRNKEYQMKIRKGDLLELSEIYRDLKTIAQQKELSFGEKSLLQQTEMLIAEEISIVEQVGEEKILSLLRSSFNKIPLRAMSYSSEKVSML